MSDGIIHTTDGMSDVVAERIRQIKKEGYLDAHDDKHDGGEIAIAATRYLAIAAEQIFYAKKVRENKHNMFPSPITLEEIVQSVDEGDLLDWPWEAASFKPSTDPRRNLVKAGAMILAEIDRLDRLAGKKASPFKPHGS